MLSASACRQALCMKLSRLHCAWSKMTKLLTTDSEHVGCNVFFEAVSMCCVSDWEVPAMAETASTFSCSGDADWMNTWSVTLWYNCVEGQHDLDLMAASTSTCVFCSTSDSMPKTPTTHCSHLSTHQLSHISCFSGTVRSIRRTFRTRFDLMLSCSMLPNEMV